MKLKLVVLLSVFLVNFVVVDSITTIVAVDIHGNCYESNIVVKDLGLLKAKLLFVLIVVPTALWLYSVDSKVAVETLKLLTAFSFGVVLNNVCLLYTSPSPRDRTRSRMPSSA